MKYGIEFYQSKSKSPEFIKFYETKEIRDAKFEEMSKREKRWINIGDNIDIDLDLIDKLVEINEEGE